MKRVCFLRSKSPPIIEARISKDASALAKQGWEVTLLEWDREANKPTHEQINKIKIVRLHHRAPYNSPLVAFHLIIWWLKVLHYLLAHRFDVLHACDFDTLPPCLLIRFLKATLVVYDQFDFYAQMIELPIPSFIRFLIANSERRFLNYADQVIIADETRKDQIGKSRKKVWIITNSPPDYYDKLLTEVPEETFSIFYGGNLIKTRGLEGVAKVVSSLASVKLVIAGYGPDEPTLVSLFNSTRQVEYIGPINYEKIIEHTFRSSLIFALYDPKVPNNKYASPNKLFEAMMTGKPIIVSSGSSMARIVKEEECGIIIDYGDTEALKKVLARLRDNQTWRKKLGANGRRAYLEKYNWHLMEKRLIRIYEGLEDIS
jgi:glycosyltransferase involved in cell wall biosynthesis